MPLIKMAELIVSLILHTVYTVHYTAVITALFKFSVMYVYVNLFFRIFLLVSGVKQSLHRTHGTLVPYPIKKVESILSNFLYND